MSKYTLYTPDTASVKKDKPAKGVFLFFMQHAVICSLGLLCLGQTLLGATLHEYDVGSAGVFHDRFPDMIGSDDLSASFGTGGSTTVVFTDDSRVSISRAFTARAANLNAGAANGLANGTYTFELWIHFDGSVTAGEVVFETGGEANGIGIFTRTNGLELATASTTTGADARAAISFSGLDLSHYLQVVGIFDTDSNSITLTATDVDGTTVSNVATSAHSLFIGTGNGLALFAGGNGDFGNTSGNIGGAAATGVTLPSTPGVFSGRIGLFYVHDGVDLATPAVHFNALVLPANRADDPRPNFIIIFTDDHGYADFGLQGQDSDVSTPNLDKLASQGARMTNGYVTAPQCTPSRAGILSGRYQQTFGVDKNGQGPMDPSIVTIPERLRKAGYRTGMVGKWHLEPTAADTEWAAANGIDPTSIPLAIKKQYYPDQQGFEEFAFGYLNTYWRNFNRDGSNNDPLGLQQTETGHRCDIQGEFAVEFIERNHDRPFYLYLAFFAPHVPLEWVNRYQNYFDPSLPTKRQQALGMIKAVDDGVGNIMAKLEEHGLDKNTIIWFIGDNGAPLGYHEAGNIGATDAASAWNGSLNAPLIGEKGMLADGGIRVPWMMYWKGTIPAQAYTNPVISLDVGATVNALAGLPDDSILDGVNLVPYITGANTSAPHDYLFWRFWHQSAIRNGKWKYIQPSVSTPRMLFDLEADMLEEENLIGQYPEIASALDAQLESWKAGLFRPGDSQGTSLNSQEAPWYKRHFGIGLAYEFNTAGNNGGWVSSGVTSPTVANGEWMGQTTAGAMLTQTDFLVVGASVDRVLVKTTIPQSGTVELQWKNRNGTSFTSSRSVSLPVTASPNPQWLVFPMEEEADWHDEMVTEVRLLLSSSGSQQLAIDFIRASDGDYDRDGIDDIVDGAIDIYSNRFANPVLNPAIFILLLSK